VWGFDADFEGNLIGRWFGLLMEKMLAPDYEKGLPKLKTLLESEPVSAPVAPAPEMAAGFVDAAPRVSAPGAKKNPKAETSDRIRYWLQRPFGLIPSKPAFCSFTRVTDALASLA